jgi:TolB-like protein
MVTPAEDSYAPTQQGTGSGPVSRPVPDASLVGRRLGDYEILEQLGQGGMGIVYRARDGALDREVALKVLQPALATDEEYERRFIREAKTAAKLDHPNIVAVYAAGRCENVLFMAMQLVRGRTLHQVLREKKRLPVAEALAIVRQSAEALEAAHKAGLVHRDIKPNNIMVDDRDRVKIMDFGLMRSKMGGEAITRSGDFFGTPEYASPEQCETAELDGRSDLYSLGVVLYEMLTGRMPHKAETPLALFKKILHEKPRSVRAINPDVPAVVEALVSKMMAKRPSQRFASAAELVAEIDRIGRGGKMLRTPWRTRAVLALAGAATVLMAAGFWYFTTRAPEAGPGPTGPGSGMGTPVAQVNRLRLVVFDFKNGTPEEATNWYGSALSDLMIASLSQHPGIEVPTRDQLLWKVKEMRLGGPAGDDHRRILTHELGAAAYLSGTYYVRGGKLRVTLAGYRLPQNGALFAPKAFEKGEDEMFALVDEAARAIAKDLEHASMPGAAFSAVSDVRPCAEVAVAYRRSAGNEKNALKELGAAREDRHLALAGESDRRPGAGAAGRPSAEPSRALLQAQESKKGADAKDKESGEPHRPAKAEKSAAPAPFPPAPQTGAPHAAAEEAKSRKSVAPMGDAELMKAWYQNLHALEQCKFQKEEFDTLATSLRGQFQAGSVDTASWKQGVENFKDGLDRLREARQQNAQPRGRTSVEFLCPGCGAVAPEFGRCPPCDRYLVLRIRVAGNEKKE